MAIAVTLAAACSGSDGNGETTDTTSRSLTGTTQSGAPSGTAQPSDTAVAPPTESTDTTAATPPVPPPPPPPVDESVDPAALRAAYANAFIQTCNSIWSISPNGVLYDPDDEDQVPYTVDDCLAELVESDGEIAETVEEAHELGVEAANDTAYFFTSGDQLCNGSRCWTYP